MTHEQRKCSNCGQYKLKSDREMRRDVGVTAFVLAVFSTLLIPLGIGIFLVPIFALISLAAFVTMTLDERNTYCKNCKAKGAL